MPTTFYLRDTNDDTTCDVSEKSRDLSETQGTSAPMTSDNVSSSEFWTRVLALDIDVTSLSPPGGTTEDYDVSVDINTLSSAAQVRWRLVWVDEDDSCNEVAFSGYSAVYTNNGIKTDTLSLFRSATSDPLRLRIVFEVWRDAGAHGNKNVNLNVNDADSWILAPWPSAGEDELGAADLDGVGTTLIKARVDHVPKFAKTGAATLAASPHPDVNAKAPLSGSAILAAEGTVEVVELGAASLTGSATTAHLSEVEHSAKASLSGSATLTGQAKPDVDAKASLTGSAILAAEATVEAEKLGAAALSGFATLAAIGEVEHSAKAALTGSLTLVGMPLPIVNAKASLSGSAVLAADATVEVVELGAAALTGSGLVAAVAEVEHPAKSSLAASGALAGVSLVEHSGKAALTGSAVLVALPLPEVDGKAALTGSATLSGAPRADREGKGALTGSAVLGAEGTVVGAGVEHLGEAALLVTAAAVFDAELAPRGAVSLVGTATTSIQGNVELPADAFLAVSVLLGATAKIESDNVVFTQYGPTRRFFHENLGPDEEVAVTFAARLKRTGTHAAVAILRDDQGTEYARLENPSTAYVIKESGRLDLRGASFFEAALGRKASGQAVEMDFAAIRVRSRGPETAEGLAPLTVSAVLAGRGTGGTLFGDVYIELGLFDALISKGSVDYKPKAAATGAATVAAEGTVTP